MRRILVDTKVILSAADLLTNAGDDADERPDLRSGVWRSQFLKQAILHTLNFLNSLSSSCLHCCCLLDFQLWPQANKILSSAVDRHCLVDYPMCWCEERDGKRH